MPLSIVVVIRDDPRKTHRPVEALRIALGLGSGENPLSVVLLNEAPLLLASQDEEIIDGDILEKYLPSLKQTGTLFFVELSTRSRFDLDDDFNVKELPLPEIERHISVAERVLAF